MLYYCQTIYKYIFFNYWSPLVCFLLFHSHPTSADVIELTVTSYSIECPNWRIKDLRQYVVISGNSRLSHSSYSNCSPRSHPSWPYLLWLQRSETIDSPKNLMPTYSSDSPSWDFLLEYCILLQLHKGLFNTFIECRDSALIDETRLATFYSLVKKT